MQTFFASLVVGAGNSPITGEFPAQRPVTRSIDVFFDLRINKRLSKQSRGWWFETPSRSLWRHCNVIRKEAHQKPYTISNDENVRVMFYQKQNSSKSAYTNDIFNMVFDRIAPESGNIMLYLLKQFEINILMTQSRYIETLICFITVTIHTMCIQNVKVLRCSLNGLNANSCLSAHLRSSRTLNIICAFWNFSFTLFIPRGSIFLCTVVCRLLFCQDITGIVMITVIHAASKYDTSKNHNYDVIKWKHFPHYWPFVRGIHRSQRPVTRSIDAFFDLRLNKRLSKQWWGWWFEMPSRQLWRHSNDIQDHFLYRRIHYLLPVSNALKETTFKKPPINYRFS